MVRIVVRKETLTFEFDVNIDVAYGIYTAHYLTDSYNDLTISIDNVTVVYRTFDPNYWEHFHRLFEIIGPTNSKRVLINISFVEWNLSSHTWLEYINSLREKTLSLFMPLRRFIEEYNFTIVLIGNDNKAAVYVTNSIDFIQGVISVYNWLNIDYRNYIKYIVRNTDQQLMTIVN